MVGEATVRAEPDEALVFVTLSALEDTPGPALQDVFRRGEALAAPSTLSTDGKIMRDRR